MKKMLLTLAAILTITMSARAMSYEQARSEALFLTDKMAYELNLTDEQYEAAYEINLDYLMGVTGRNDVFGTSWERRNLDLSYILLDWQWNAFLAATYFYRPLYWDAGYWHFGVYRVYPHRDYFYFGRPHFYATYRGGHAWHVHGGHGYYYGRRAHFRAPRQHFGMHDRWTRGDFRAPRHSSTRITAGPGYHSHRNSFGASNGNRGLLENNGNRGRIESRSGNMNMNRSGNGNMNRSGNSNMNRSEYGNSNRPTRTFGGSNGSQHHSYGGGSSYSGGTRTFGGGSSSRSGGAFGGGSSSGGSHGSFHGGGGSHGGDSHGGGGSHFGGHR